jgi:hypothetical protein
MQGQSEINGEGAILACPSDCWTMRHPEAVRNALPPETRRAILQRIHLQDAGTGVKVERAKMSGDITIEDVTAQGSGGPHPNP